MLGTRSKGKELVSGGLVKKKKYAQDMRVNNMIISYYLYNIIIIVIPEVEP